MDQETVNFRTSLLPVKNQAVAEALLLADTADTRDIDGWFANLLALLLNRVRSSWFTARGLTGGYLRRHALDNGHLIDPVFGDFEPDRVAASLRIAAPVAFKKAWRGDPDAAKKVMRTKLAGTVSRIVLNGARDTIHRTTRESRVIVGWRRVTDADPCFFCAMLAGRGAVYKSGRTAGDPRWGGEPYHDHCQCTALPLYEHEDEPPEVDDLYEQWQAATAGRSGSAAIRAWRRHWESRRR